jgi:peptide/nickel transport system substrate-binding protein
MVTDIDCEPEGGDENVRLDENDNRERPIDVNRYNSKRRDNPMKTKMLWVAFSCLMVAALVLTASTPAAEGKEAPQYGGTVNFSLTTVPPGWDLNGKATYYCMHWNQHYERLMIGDIDGAGPRGKNLVSFAGWNSVPISTIKMHLAESVELPNPHTIVFKIRKGVHFHNKPPVNGRELDAKDVALSLSRLWNVPRFKTGYWQFVDSIEATDKYTVTMKLNRFDAAWKWLFGPGWYNAIQPRELVEQDLVNKWEYVAGTGPFMLKDYKADVGATFVRNPDYWGTTTIDGKEYKLPFVDKIQQYIIPDEAAWTAAMRTGKLDLVRNITQVQRSSIVKKAKNLKSAKTPRAGMALGFRADKKELPTFDRKVRKALVMAIDWDDINQKIYQGDALRRYYVLVPADWSADIATTVDELPAELREAYGHNPEKAKKLLAEAGYPNGFKTILAIGTPSETQVDAASLFADYWKRIGVEAKIQAREQGVHMSKLTMGQHDPIGIFWLGDPPLQSASIQRAIGGYNWGRYSPPGYPEKLKAVLSEMDTKKMAQGMKELNIMHALSFHTVHIGAPYSYNLWWPWVKNYYGEVDVGHVLIEPIFARIVIDQKLKKKMGK